MEKMYGLLVEPTRLLSTGSKGLDGNRCESPAGDFGISNGIPEACEAQ
jgi:hypothetical protein